MKLTEARKKLRALLKKVLKKLGIQIKSVAKIFAKEARDAFTEEYKIGLAILKDAGTKMIAELSEKACSGDMKRDDWLTWAPGWIEGHAEEIKEAYGAEVRLPKRVLDLILSTLYNAWRNKQK